MGSGALSPRKFVWYAAPITVSHLCLGLTVYLFLPTRHSLPLSALRAGGGGVEAGGGVGAEDKGPAFRPLKVVLWRHPKQLQGNRIAESWFKLFKKKARYTQHFSLAFKGVVT